MPEHPEDFALPWCQKILKDPSYMKIPLQNRLPPARFSSMGSNRCFAQTLNTPDSMRNYQPIYHPASSTGPKEHLVLVSVGSGLDSWDGILSGGILCLLVDNVCAIMASTEFGGREAVTVELVTRFKRKMHTPGVALCRAREEKREGRKLWIRGTVEDGMGQVFAEADALFWDPGVGVKVGKSKDRSGLEGKRSGNVELKQSQEQSRSVVKAKL